jgi:hypothetical protein
MVALPCLIAAAIFGVRLVGQMRAQGNSQLARAAALGLCVANPLTLRALEIGHPEELLGAVLCAAAVFAAMRGRPLWAGVLLGLAIANKQWALLAVGPVLLALPGRRVRSMTAAAAIAAALFIPLVLAQSTGAVSGAGIGAPSASAFFQPWQAWWFLGAPTHVALPTHAVRTVALAVAPSARPGFRTQPAWLTGVSHPLIIGLAVPLTLLAWRGRRRVGTPLLLLALLLLLRCVLDPWDVIYYPIPFIFGLLSWETLNPRRAPALSLLATTAVWVLFQELPARGVTPDATAAVFLALAASTLIALAAGLYAPERWRVRRSHRTAGAVVDGAAVAVH